MNKTNFKIGDLVVVDNTDQKSQEKYLGKIGKIIDITSSRISNTETIRFKLIDNDKELNLFSRKLKPVNNVGANKKQNHPFTKIFV